MSFGEVYWIRYHCGNQDHSFAKVISIYLTAIMCPSSSRFQFTNLRQIIINCYARFLSVTQLSCAVLNHSCMRQTLPVLLVVGPGTWGISKTCSLCSVVAICLLLATLRRASCPSDAALLSLASVVLSRSVRST